MQLEQQQSFFLNVLIKNRDEWKHSREFSKIIEKIQKGKNLNKKEFTKIHWIIWETGRYS